MKIIKSPVTKKRIAKFKEQPLAYFSFCLLLFCYVLSLFAELFCNSAPLYLRHNGKSYFPVLKFYSEDVFLNNGRKTRPDYRQLNESAGFKELSSNYMVFPLFKYGPLESIEPDSLAAGNSVELILSPVDRVGNVNIRKNYTIAKSASFASFTNSSEAELKDSNLSDYLPVSDGLKQAVERRFENKDDSDYSEIVSLSNKEKIILALSTYSKRSRPPKTVRVKLRENILPGVKPEKILFSRDLDIEGLTPELWHSLSQKERSELIMLVKKRFSMPVDLYRFKIDKKLYQASFEKQDIRFPYKPVANHCLGIDGAGRDVFARIFYGLRTSLSFGLLLVFFSMAIGIAAGAVQGYFGGKTDITSQRFIEIWSALPFLYIMILMGSIYGRSFLLLLFCYGIFNWIGISYYVRAEFFRLRKQAFVESAKCMGMPSWKIIFKHIMPNAMTPVVTFFPFSLVGAIGSLAALDYLGFGLPPPTPSWGELFFQAQQYRWAWWLILYPACALFFVMIAGVFVGDGIRNAYDPKKYTRLE